MKPKTETTKMNSTQFNLTPEQQVLLQSVNIEQLMAQALQDCQAALQNSQKLSQKLE